MYSGLRIIDCIYLDEGISEANFFPTIRRIEKLLQSPSTTGTYGIISCEIGGQSLSMEWRPTTPSASTLQSLASGLLSWVLTRTSTRYPAIITIGCWENSTPSLQNKE